MRKIAIIFLLLAALLLAACSSGGYLVIGGGNQGGNQNHNQGEAQNPDNNLDGVYFVLNTNSRLIHTSTCGIGLRISAANRAVSNCIHDAISRGFNPCRTCLRDFDASQAPPVYDTDDDCYDCCPLYEPVGAAYYIGNTNSRAFHANTCGSGQRISAANRRIFTTFSEAVATGFHPCGICLRDREFTPPPPQPPQNNTPNNPPQNNTPNHPPAAAYYIGNISSRAFHANTCGSGQRIAASNRRIFATFDQAVAAGFHPCGICLRHRDFTPPPPNNNQPTQTTPSEQTNPPVNQPPESGIYFIGNINTSVIHRHTCGSGQRIGQANRRIFLCLDEALAAGFRTCGICIR